VHSLGAERSAMSRRRFLVAAAAVAGSVAFPGVLGGCTSSVTSGGFAKDPPLERKIAQMLLVGFRGLTLEATNYIYRDIQKYRIGGTIVFDRDAKLKTYGRNITSPAQLRALTASLRAISPTPLFIAVDQEGGKVARLKESYGFPPTVSAQYLGTLNDPAVTKQYADSMAATLADNGLNMNFAPVLDLNVNPESPAIGALERSFSAPTVEAVSNEDLTETEHAIEISYEGSYELDEATLADGSTLDDHFSAMGGWISSTLVRLGDLNFEFLPPLEKDDS